MRATRRNGKWTQEEDKREASKQREEKTNKPHKTKVLTQPFHKADSNKHKSFYPKSIGRLSKKIYKYSLMQPCEEESKQFLKNM